MAQPSLYTISPTRSFVDTLAKGVWNQAAGNPLDLARYQILLPTRRSCRSLREAFLRLSGGTPTLLPRMIPIGDIDEDELLLSGGLEIGDNAPDALGLSPVISGLRRQLLLTELIRKRPPHPSPDQAALLAREMGELIDQVATERLDFSDLKNLDVSNFAEHWNETLEFLDLVTDFWPQILDQEGALDPAVRRNLLLETQANAWRKSPPDTPVIAAGSTGSIPATADLLKVVAYMPNGSVVLPGLDKALPDDAWNAIGPTHPQYGLKHLLACIEVARHDVAEWTEEVEKPDNEPTTARTELLRHALLPAPVTGNQISIGHLPSTTLDGVTRVDCPDSGKEAEVIALVMRESLETPGKTAALITPDRFLARRVAMDLKRWGIHIDDSAGAPLAQTPPATFLQLTAEMMTSDLAPVPLLAALKHPMAAGACNPAQFRENIRELEIATLRGPRPASGFDGLIADIDEINHPDLPAFVVGLHELAKPFMACLSQSDASVRDIVHTHVSFAEALASTHELSGAARLWAGDAGEALALFIAELHDALDESIAIDAREYAVLLKTLMMSRVVRPKHGRHPRLSIWRPLEARLQHADVIILGGLNEGVWPPEPPSNPWMSRPMMTAFGLPVPERRIGLSAHDFAQSFSAQNVFLTRAERTDGTPTVPSRWLRRLDNLVSTGPLKEAFATDQKWLSLALALDKPEASIVVDPPAPRPPLAARPRELSVTRIRILQRDPYAIYARHVLGLRPLDHIDADPGAADRGTVIHDALDEFLKMFPNDLPVDAVDHLIQIGERQFSNHITQPGVRAFWWPRFLRIAEWFVTNERERREAGEHPVATESIGEAKFNAPGGEFKLRARADRIDRLPDGGLAIIDYKTGQPPTAPQAITGLEPQLPLEAAMIQHGSFAGVERDEVRRLTYIKLTGGRVSGEVRSLKLDVPTVAEDAWTGLKNLISEYDNPDKPYLSHLRPMKQREVGDYDHLARVREWLSAEEDS